MKRRSRVVFVGTVQASESALRAILGLNDVEVVAVVTKKTSTFNADHRDLSALADLHAVPWKYVKDINAPHIHDWLKERKPDALFVSGWSQLLSPATLTLAPLGAIGFHPALLPENRGRHPLIWAIVLGLHETGSTFFVMDETPDGGGILSQKRVTIDERETAGSLYRKIEQAVVRQIPDFLPRYLAGDLKPVSEQCGSNSWRKRSRQDGLIDFRMSTGAIDRLVRALAPPYPGAEVELQGNRFVVTDARPAAGSYEQKHEPGKVLHVDTQTWEITVKTSDTAIVLREHTIEELPQVGSYIL